MFRSRQAMLVLVPALLALAALPAFAQEDVAAFYKDKTIRIVVGSAAGGGYDIGARILARIWPSHIPGKPIIVVQNQVGAGSVTMANTVYNTGARDGTVIGAPINGMPTAPSLTPDVVKFDITKVIWIGSTNRDTQVSYVWKTAPVQSMAELKEKVLVVGATTPGTTQVDYPVVANAILGTKFKIISGYEGTANIHTAMETGEVQAMGANGWLSVKALKSAWLADGSVKVIMQYGAVKNPEIANVPSIFELAKTDEERQALTLMTARLDYGRPFFLPPEVPAARVEALRRSFDATVKDPAFLEEAEKAKLELSPITGEEVAKLVAEVNKTPPAVVARVKAALDGGGK